jgi:hypothetical protein
MFKFIATTSTEDGRLTEGKVYEGGFSTRGQYGYLRIVVYDNKNEWMTFNPKVFKPMTQSLALTDSQD